MIHIESIRLSNFKGIDGLHCEFDDFTLLAGVNNSGKTTLLQAVYLLINALPSIAKHQHLNHTRAENRRISLQAALPKLGLRDTSWLQSRLNPNEPGIIGGVFSNGLELELTLFEGSTSEFLFLASHAEDNRAALVEAERITAAMLNPPGEIPTRELMVNGSAYDSQLRDGQGAQLWRNGIWWSIQREGLEQFQPIQEKVKKYFPMVDLLLPTLSSSGSPEILIRYEENGVGPFDIAQSGAGLRTFLSLAQILNQSDAGVLLLDEPDAHLHAAQQAVVLNLLLDLAASSDRQIIIASHSPELLTRTPPECIRWVERGKASATGGFDVGLMLEQMGVASDVYLPQANLPDVLVYVEGVDDRPVIEAVINWSRSQQDSPLPSTLVIPHRDGRFNGPTLQGIARLAKALKSSVRVIGIRDLDWYYDELVPEEPDEQSSDGWSLITLPCKELENIFCDPEFLFTAYGEKIDQESIKELVNNESNSLELVEQWCFQVRPRIRDRLSTSLDESTRERMADETFRRWRENDDIRRRLVAEKLLLGRIRQQIQKEHRLRCYPTRAIANASSLPKLLRFVAQKIFPSIEFTSYSETQSHEELS